LLAEVLHVKVSAEFLLMSGGRKAAEAMKIKSALLMEK
jgi:hypothetical protein